MDIVEARRVWLEVLLGYGKLVFQLYILAMCNKRHTTIFLDPTVQEVKAGPIANTKVGAEAPPPNPKTMTATSTSATFHNGLPRFSYSAHGEIMYESDSDSGSDDTSR
jgi:hypothetical protein